MWIDGLVPYITTCAGSTAATKPQTRGKLMVRAGTITHGLPAQARPLRPGCTAEHASGWVAGLFSQNETALLLPSAFCALSCLTPLLAGLSGLGND
jgi:hypothetical protein